MPTYRVIGPQAVHDTPSGETFTADLPPDQEEFLIAVGHIREEKREQPSLKTVHGGDRIGKDGPLRHKPSDAERR